LIRSFHYDISARLLIFTVLQILITDIAARYAFIFWLAAAADIAFDCQKLPIFHSQFSTDDIVLRADIFDRCHAAIIFAFAISSPCLASLRQLNMY
jgi:hypothetical protein